MITDTRHTSHEQLGLSGRWWWLHRQGGQTQEKFFECSSFRVLSPSNPQNNAHSVLTETAGTVRKPVNSVSQWIDTAVPDPPGNQPALDHGCVRTFESSFSDTVIDREKHFRCSASQRRPLQVFLSGSLESGIRDWRNVQISPCACARTLQRSGPRPKPMPMAMGSVSGALSLGRSTALRHDSVTRTPGPLPRGHK